MQNPDRGTRRAYARVLLKLSGESFASEGAFGIHPTELATMASEIGGAVACGSQMAIVVGGGNIIRGSHLAASGRFDQSTADYMGMLGTVINGLALKEALKSAGVESRVMSAVAVPSVAESFIRARALRHFEKGRVIILVAGTGNPYFTTDTCAALRAVELGCDVLLKATKVDGVYSADPRKDRSATRYSTISFGNALEQKLRVMDLTAMTMCMEHSLPVVVFDYKVAGNIRRAVSGEGLGTLVTVS